MLYPISKADQIKNETLLHRAKGIDFQRILSMYGFHRLPFIPEQYVREALRAVAYGARGTVGIAFAFFKNLLQGWIDSTETQVIAIGSRTLQGSGFHTRFEGRWVEIDGKIYYLERVSGSTNLIFSDIDTSLWNKASFTVGNTYTIKILPFWIAQDDKGLFAVYVDGSIFNAPTTYLREDGEPRETDPNGGILVPQAQVSGDTPALYFASSDISSVIAYAWEQILSAGIHGKLLSREWTPQAEPQIFSSIYNSNLGFFGDIIRVEASNF